MKKNQSIIIVLVVVFLIIAFICFKIIFNKEDNTIKPYMEEHNVKITTLDQDISIPTLPYTKDENKNIVDIDGVTPEKSTMKYTFYDYSISDTEEEGYSLYSFKYNVDTTISWTVDESKSTPRYSCTYSVLIPTITDYYTGDLCKEKSESVSGNISFHNLDLSEGDMNYTDITWDGKTYKIGVRMEMSSKWDSSKNEGNRYSRSNHIEAITYVYAPKDYDGLMISLNKNGTSKERLLSQIEFNNKYNELLLQESETGEKSDELLKMEEQAKKVYKLLEKMYVDEEYNTDDFYIFKVSNIKPIQE